MLNVGSQEQKVSSYYSWAVLSPAPGWATATPPPDLTRQLQESFLVSLTLTLWRRRAAVAELQAAKTKKERQAA